MEKRTLSRLKDQERETRKNLILDAAEKVFAVKLYNAVSMQEIADEAGLAKSSIYTYFPTQEVLFVEVVLRDADILFKELERILEGKKKTDLGKMINAFLDFFSEREAFFRMSSQFMLYGNISHESIEKLNPITRRMLDIFDQLFLRLEYKGNVRILSHTLFAALSGILIAYRKYPGRSEEDIRKHMKRIGENIREMMEIYIKQTLKNSLKSGLNLRR
ncbi:MAG: TetR/AcrR family transcriptional regulator [Smithella sp.]